MKNTKQDYAPTTIPNARHLLKRATKQGWRIVTDDTGVPLRYEQGVYVKIINPDTVHFAFVTDESLAHLFAAAPELLAACKAALAYLDANRPKGNIRKIFSALNEHENGAVKPLRAAIAKAERGQL